MEKVLERFGIVNAKLVTNTSLENYFKLCTTRFPWTDNEVHDMSKVPYVIAMGCLMYAMVSTRPGLAQDVSVSTSDYGIMFGMQQSDPSVLGFVDAGYVGDFDDRKSTTRYVMGGPICWKSRVQSQVALFTTKLGYMAVTEVTMDKFKHCLDLVNVSNF
ncbi:secreted RxLR effector protein 161-like [Malania oleifera]|uniref:secreted RxLR effector protein 161-like n=1 Tax=Malania oleifera TaxID=397392 RepID=UPI0025AE7BA0|nr:secreted RxLR effector protein 161-like [Malania oleifera]